MNFKFQSPATLVFLVGSKNCRFKSCHPSKVYQRTKLSGPKLTGPSLHPPQKFERPPFWNG